MFCILSERGALSLNIFIKGPDVRVPVPWRACRCSGPVWLATTPAVIIAPSGALERLAWQRTNPVSSACGGYGFIIRILLRLSGKTLMQLLSALGGA